MKNKMKLSNNINSCTSCKSLIWRIIKSAVTVPENFLGVWLGSLLIVVFYLIYSVTVRYHDDSTSSMPASVHLTTLWPAASPASGKTSASSSSSAIMIPLFWISIILLCLLMAVWGILVWGSEEVCLADTRYRDFEKVLLLHDTDKIEAIPSHLFCRTSMMIKPLRSKYCTQSGYVVPRMDHFCVWLNRAIGYGNHRLFMAFVITHWVVNLLLCTLLISALVRLVASNGNGSGSENALEVCSVLSALLSSRGLLPLALGMFLVYMTLSLTTLLVEQCQNIVSNQTTNERINGERYPWYCHGNRFDRGVWSNIGEFLHLSPCHINYHKVYDMPPPRPAPQPPADETDHDRCVLLRNFFSYFHNSINHNAGNKSTSNSHFQIVLNSVQNVLFDSNLVDTPTHD